MCDILLSLALTHESLGNKHEAIAAATEVIDRSPNNSADYLQAKAVIAGFTDDRADRIRQLKHFHRRALNYNCYTVADNIALELARESGDPEQTLRHLAAVRTRRELEYNYVRATIRRIETLIQADRLSEINCLDRKVLERSYGLAYSQRLLGIFDWCHRVSWTYFEATHDHSRQRNIFV